MFSIRNVDSHLITITSQLLLKITAHSVQHLKLESVFCNTFFLRIVDRRLDHSGIMGRNGVACATGKKQFHDANIIIIDVFLIGESNVIPFIVCSLANSDSCRNLQQIPGVVVSAPQV